MSRGLAAAVDILGFSHVVNSGQAGILWGMAPPSTSEVVRYSEETLQRATEENNRGRDWNLLYLFDLSLDDQAGARAVLPDGSLKICDRSIFAETGDEWRRERAGIPAGYFLIDFTCDFRDKKPEEQRDLVEGRSVWWERADDRIVLQGLVSLRLTHDRELLRGLAHRGPRRTKTGRYIIVGNFDGYLFFKDVHDIRNEDLGVCILRKPDDMKNWIK